VTPQSRTAAAIVGFVLVTGLTARADFTSAITAVMGPYYAALTASERGDAESTQRDLGLLSAKWELVGREEPPAALKADPQWHADVQKIGEIIRQTGELVRLRNLSKAHIELEGLRLVLRQARGRHDMLVLDDWLTDYHEAMERVCVRASMQNEIVLADADYVEMQHDLSRAETLWADVERQAGKLASQPAWSAAARRITAAQIDLDLALTRRNGAAIAKNAEALKTAYHDLLVALSHADRS